jgi:hypothetical protein
MCRALIGKEARTTAFVGWKPGSTSQTKTHENRYGHLKNAALVSRRNGSMCNSKQILAIGVMASLASLAGCAGKIRYPSYYVLNVPAVPSGNDRPKPILGSVAVREFSAPGFLRGGPIA